MNINVVLHAEHLELGLAVLAHVLLEPLVRGCLLHFFDIVRPVGGAHHFDAVPDRLLDFLVGAATLSVSADEAIKLLPHRVVLLPRVARVRQFVADHLGDLVRRDRIVHHSRAETNVRATGGGWVLAHSATARSAIEDEHVRAEVRLCLLAHPRVVEDALHFRCVYKGRMSAIRVKKFDPSTIKESRILFIIGKRHTGKSVLMKDLLYQKQKVPHTHTHGHRARHARHPHGGTTRAERRQAVSPQPPSSPPLAPGSPSSPTTPLTS